MLELLARYAQQRMGGVEPGFRAKGVRWALVFSEDGRFLDVVELGEVEQKRNRGQLFPKCPDLSFSELLSGGEPKSHFLVERAQVVTLLGQDDADSRIRIKHAYFLGLLRQASSVMPELGPVADQLADPAVLAGIRNRLTSLKARPVDSVTLRVGGSYPLDSSACHEWWRGFRRDLALDNKPGEAGAAPQSEATAPAHMGDMRCLATGELTRPVRTQPKVFGLVRHGGLPSGDALISFDKDAFTSYGLEQSLNAAVSEQAATAYTSALTELIRERGHDLAGLRVVCWFKEKVPPKDDPMPWLVEGAEQAELQARQRARDLLESIRTGRQSELGRNRFYALALRGAAGRVMVRDWMEGAFEQLVSSIDTWFRDLEMVNLAGTVQQAPGLERVVTSLLPAQGDRRYADWVKPIGGDRVALWHSAVKGDAIPYSTIARIVVLNTAFHLSGLLEEQQAGAAFLLRIRMALVKAYWNRKARRSGGEAVPVQLQAYLTEDHPHPAYHCGRIMAVLAQIQRLALGDVGAGVVQRYYAAASATPALVLGRLVRTAQFHLDKINSRRRRDELDQSLAAIWASIRDRVPKTLSLEEQSMFALGYYQQKAAGRHISDSGDERGVDATKEERQ